MLKVSEFADICSILLSNSNSNTYRVLFYLYHLVFDTINLRWQLSSREFLTPLSYDDSIAFQLSNGNIRRPDIRTDYMTGVPGVTTREMFWVGFEELCGIPDQLVRPINNLMKGIRDPIPMAVKRLSHSIIEKYFPAFLSGNFSGILHTFEDVGECNTKCLPLPKPTFMRETEIGRRQFEAFAFDVGLNEAIIDSFERQYYRLWADLNRSKYCSPYVTTY